MHRSIFPFVLGVLVLAGCASTGGGPPAIKSFEAVADPRWPLEKTDPPLWKSGKPFALSFELTAPGYPIVFHWTRTRVSPG